MPRQTAILAALLLLGPLTVVGAGDAGAATPWRTGSVGGSNPTWVAHSFPVEGNAVIDASLAWEGSADLNLFLRSPEGEFVATSTSRHDNPETIRHRAATAGQWTLGIKARTGSADYRLNVMTSGAAHVFTGTETEEAGWQPHAFAASAGDRLDATLTWEGPADLNLFLQSPDGRVVASSTGGTANPELLSHRLDASGDWLIAVNSAGGSAEYRLVVDLASSTPAMEEHAPTQSPRNPDGPGIWAVVQETPGASPTRSGAIAAAQAFDLITAWHFTLREHSHHMRQANPDLVLGAYLNGAFAQSFEKDSYPADWYLYDQTGQKIGSRWGLWLMDPGHPGWVAHRIQTCREHMAAGGYNGCFVDNLGTGTLWPPSLTGQPVNPRTGQTWSHEDWLAATTSMSSRMREAVRPAPIIVNGLVSGTSYAQRVAPTSVLLEHADMALAETFIRTARAPLSGDRSVSAWRADVDMLLDATRRDRQILVMTKVWNANATKADVERWHEYAFASFLMGDDGTHLFAFSGAPDSDRLTVREEWDVDLGAATGSYRHRGADVHERSFQRGLVLANPGTSTRWVPLDRPYRRIDGRSVSGGISLAPRSGAVLLVD